MNNRFSKMGVMVVGTAMVFTTLSLTACVRPKDVVRSTVVTETTPGQEKVEMQTVESHKNAKGRTVIQKQTITEKATCVNAKGKRLKVNSFEECIQAGGKVIEEEVVKESKY